MEQRLQDKVAIVTGAGYGIGKGIAKRLSREGAAVVVSYGHSQKDADETADEIRASGGQVQTIKADVTKKIEIDQMILATINTFGGLDILVNNAGVANQTWLLNMEEEMWDWMIDINLKGPYLCSRAAAIQMVQQGRGGRIIQIGSVNSTKSVPGRSHYAASKAGLVAMNKIYAAELAQYKITCNIVSPGATESRMTEPYLRDPVEYERMIGAIPLKRIGTPEDIAAMVAFLSTDEASYITGVNIDVDGGLLVNPLFV